MEESVSGVDKKERKMATIWNFYLKKKEGGECKLCKNIIKTPSCSTSGLLRHLKQHPAAEKEFNKITAEEKKTSSRQLSMFECVAKKQKLCISDVRKNQIDKKIAIMMACDFQPYSMVDDHGFRGLINELEPSYEIPSRTTFSRTVIPQLYQEERTKLADEISTDAINGLESLSFTTDTWSSRRHESYISLTGHYLTEEFKLKCHILGNYHFPGSHTADAVHAKLVGAMEEWNLPTDQVPVYVITDNAKNLKCAIRKTLFHHVQCFAHTLQLALHDAKNEHDITALLAKGRAIVGHYRHSNVARERLHALQVKLNKPVHELLPMVPTRWNSEYTMLSRLVEQQVPISADLGESMAVENFTSSEWKLAASIAHILQPIDEATTELCYSKFPTLSSKIPLIYGIEAMLTNYVQTDQCKSGTAFAKSLQRGLKSRFPSYSCVKEDLLSMALDPRFKTVILQDHEKLLCTKYITSHQQPENDYRPEPELEQVSEAKETCSLWSSFEVLKKTSQSSVRTKSSSLEEELKIYLREDVIPRNGDPLTWWKNNKIRFPALAKVARRYLAIPATQVESERLFSTAGNTVSIRRENLLAENVEKLVFLNSRFRP